MTNFWAKHRVFLLWRGAKILELQMRNGLHFWIQHGKSRLLVSGKEILARYESPKGHKTPKNGLSAPFLTHRKQSWENGDLEGQMSTKFKIPMGLESRQDRISKKPTWAHFGHLKVPQNRLQSGTTHREFGTAHRGKNCQFAPVSRNFGSRLLQVGPVIYTSFFWHQRRNLKSFLSRWASIQVAKECKGPPQPNVMLESAAPVADGWLSISFS